MEIFLFAKRVNVNIVGISKIFDLEEYKVQLRKIKDYLIRNIKQKGILENEINLLTDILHIDCHCNCGAGEKSLTLGTNGQFYICPAFFSDKNEVTIGSLDKGIDNLKNSQLYTLNYAPLCKECDAYQCADCIYHNKKYTSEVNVPAAIQCKKSWIEKTVSVELQEECEKNIQFFNRLEKSKYDDPLVKLIEELDNTRLGFYPRNNTWLNGN